MTDDHKTCARCGKAKRERLPGSFTQWIFDKTSCSCEQLKVPETGSAKEYCKTCGKIVSQARHGSITQWMFRTEVCSCLNPVIATAAHYRVNQQARRPELNLENEPELDVDPSQFPTGRYKAVRTLGTGAGGKVYLCRDRLLRKNVAVKTLRTLSNEQFILFQTEARATSQLNHDAIVKILDFGSTESGAPYMVLEYFDGINLEQYLRDVGVLTLPLFKHIFESISSALAHAHKMGIFHRDLKPSNILISSAHSDEPEVKLIDFGVAKLQQNSDEAIVIQGTTIAGTPPYMSPDTVSGKTFDARSEIYSLGCVMFESLTGKVPFTGETTLEILNLHATAETPTLQEMGGKEFPVVFENLVAECLKKNPDDRFATMDELNQVLSQIEVHHESLPVTAPLVTVAPPRRIRVAAIFLIVGLGVFALVMSIVPITQTQQTLPRIEVMSPATVTEWPKIDDGMPIASSSEAFSEADAFKTGWCYQYGDSFVEKDHDEAAKWYRLAQDLGNVEAKKQLAILAASQNEEPANRDEQLIDTGISLDPVRLAEEGLSLLSDGQFVAAKNRFQRWLIVSRVHSERSQVFESLAHLSLCELAMGNTKRSQTIILEAMEMLPEKMHPEVWASSSLMPARSQMNASYCLRTFETNRSNKLFDQAMTLDPKGTIQGLWVLTYAFKNSHQLDQLENLRRWENNLCTRYSADEKLRTLLPYFRKTLAMQARTLQLSTEFVSQSDRWWSVALSTFSRTDIASGDLQYLEVLTGYCDSCIATGKVSKAKSSLEDTLSALPQDRANKKQLHALRQCLRQFAACHEKVQPPEWKEAEKYWRQLIDTFPVAEIARNSPVYSNAIVSLDNNLIRQGKSSSIIPEQLDRCKANPKATIAVYVAGSDCSPGDIVGRAHILQRLQYAKRGLSYYRDTKDDASTLAMMGRIEAIHENLYQTEEALAYLEQAVTFVRTHRSLRSDFGLTRELSKLAQFYCKLNRWKPGRVAYLEAIALLPAAPSTETEESKLQRARSELLSKMMYSTQSLWQDGEIDDAKECCSISTDIIKKIPNAVLRPYGYSISQMAGTCLLIGDLSGARLCEQKVSTFFKKRTEGKGESMALTYFSERNFLAADSAIQLNLTNKKNKLMYARALCLHALCLTALHDFTKSTAVWKEFGTVAPPLLKSNQEPLSSFFLTHTDELVSVLKVMPKVFDHDTAAIVMQNKVEFCQTFWGDGLRTVHALLDAANERMDYGCNKSIRRNYEAAREMLERTGSSKTEEMINAAVGLVDCSLSFFELPSQGERFSRYLIANDPKKNRRTGTWKFCLAVFCARQGKLEEAKKNFEEAKLLLRNEPIFWHYASYSDLYLAALHELNGNEKLAQQLLQKVRQLNIKNPKLLLIYPEVVADCALIMAQKNKQKAHTLCAHHVAEIESGNSHYLPRLQTVWGEISASSGDHVKAKELYAKVLYRLTLQHSRNKFWVERVLNDYDALPADVRDEKTNAVANALRKETAMWLVKP